MADVDPGLQEATVKLRDDEAALAVATAQRIEAEKKVKSLDEDPRRNKAFLTEGYQEWQDEKGEAQKKVAFTTAAEISANNKMWVSQANLAYLQALNVRDSFSRGTPQYIAAQKVVSAAFGFQSAAENVLGLENNIKSSLARGVTRGIDDSKENLSRKIAERKAAFEEYNKTVTDFKEADKKVQGPVAPPPLVAPPVVKTPAAVVAQPLTADPNNREAIIANELRLKGLLDIAKSKSNEVQEDLNKFRGNPSIDAEKHIELMALNNEAQKETSRIFEEYQKALTLKNALEPDKKVQATPVILKPPSEPLAAPPPGLRPLATPVSTPPAAAVVTPQPPVSPPIFTPPTAAVAAPPPSGPASPQPIPAAVPPLLTPAPVRMALPVDPKMAILKADVEKKHSLYVDARAEHVDAEEAHRTASKLSSEYAKSKNPKWIKADSESFRAYTKMDTAAKKVEAAKTAFEQANTIYEEALGKIKVSAEAEAKANADAKTAAESAALSVLQATHQVAIADAALEQADKDLAAARAARAALAAPAPDPVAEGEPPAEHPLVAPPPSKDDISALEKTQQKATDDKAVADADLRVAKSQVKFANAKLELLDAQNKLNDDPNNELKKRQLLYATAKHDDYEMLVNLEVSSKNRAEAWRNYNAETDSQKKPALDRKIELTNLEYDLAKSKSDLAWAHRDLIYEKNLLSSRSEADVLADPQANDQVVAATNKELAAQSALKHVEQKNAAMKAVYKAFDAKQPLIAAEAEVKSKREALEKVRKKAAESTNPAESLVNEQAVTNAEAALAKAVQQRDKAKAVSDAAEAERAPLVNAFNKVVAAKVAVTNAQGEVESAQQALQKAQAAVETLRTKMGMDVPNEVQAKDLAAANAELATAQAEAKTTAAKLAEAETDLKAAQANLKAADKEVDEIIKPADKKAEDNKAALTMREFIKAVERSDDLRARAGAQWSRLQKSDFGKALGEAGDRLNKNVKGFSGHHMGEAELLEAALFNMLLLLFEILFGAGKVAKAGIKEVYKQVNRNHLSSQDLRRLSVKDHKSALEEAKKYKYDPANKDKLDAALLKMAQAEATHKKHGSKASEAEYNKLKKDYDGVNKSLIDARKKYVAAKAEHELMSFSDRFKDPTKGQEVNRLEEQVRELEVSELNAYLKIKELDTKTDKISPELKAMKADRKAAGFDDTVMNAPREKYKDVQRYGELQENITELNAEKERLGTKAVDLKLELEDCEKNGSKYGANQEAIEAQKTKIQKSIKTNADKMAANATGMRDAMVEMNDLAGRIEADPAQKQMVKAEKTRTEKLFGKRAVEWMVKNLVGVAPMAVPVSDPLSKPVISVQAEDNPDEEKPNIWSKFVGKIRSLGRSKPDEASMQLMSLEMGDKEAQHKHGASKPEPTAVAGPNPASPVAPSVSSSVDAVPPPSLDHPEDILIEVLQPDVSPTPTIHSSPAVRDPEPEVVTPQAVAYSKPPKPPGLPPIEATPSLQPKPKNYQYDLNHELDIIKQRKTQGKMKSDELMPRFAHLYKLGLEYKALQNLKDRVKDFEPSMGADDLISKSVVFAYMASMPEPADGGSKEISEKDKELITQIALELNNNPDFMRELQVLRENQSKEAADQPAQNARAGSLQAEADRKKPIFPRSLSEGNSPSNSRSEPPPEPPTSGSRIKRSSSR
jgi:hypothetical protein